MRIKLVFVLLAALNLMPCGAWAQTPAALPWTVGAGTREVEGGAVLENDLIFVAGSGQASSKYYPQGAVVAWSTLPASQPGRYRVSLRARTEKLENSNLTLQVWASPEAGGIFSETALGRAPLPVASASLTGRAFDAPGKWQEFELEFDVESGKPLMVGLMYLGDDKPQLSGKVQLEKSSIQLTKIAIPVSLSHARPVKLRYKHAESGMLEVRLTNATTQPQKVQVRPVVFSDAAWSTPGASSSSASSSTGSTPGAAKEFTVPPLQTISAQVPFAVPAADGGYELSGELLLDGKVIDRRGDVFAVSDSAFQFAIHPSNSGLPFLHAAGHHLKMAGYKTQVLDKWDETVKNSAFAVEMMRRNYVTYFEHFAWAREDATALVENSDEPYLSGQTMYVESRKQIQLVNNLMKKQGIAPVAYANAIPFGWPGFLLVRERPEWFYYDPETGQVQASFDTGIMEKYFNNIQNEGYVYPVIVVDYEKPSPLDGKKYLDFHKEQLAASAKMYGWEAYRYDAGPLPTQYFPNVKQFLAKQNPPVAVGNNLGIIILGAQNSPDWKTYSQSGSLVMDESINFGFNSPQDSNRRWRDWIDFLRAGSHLTRSNGGHYAYINWNGNWLSNALGYACGAHPYGVFKSPFGDQERFMIRYGQTFWDAKTQSLQGAEKVLDVSSARPLWWKKLASQRILSATQRQIIVPLINAPVEEDVIGTTITAPASDVVVSFSPKPGEKVTAWLLSPEPVARRVELPTKTLGDGRVQVSVPKFWSWANVVFECRTG